MSDPTEVSTAARVEAWRSAPPGVADLDALCRQIDVRRRISAAYGPGWKKLAMETEAAITAGKLHPFKCPIVGQDGKEVECKGGANLADGQILGMNFYVKGIDDKLPGK